MSAAKFSIIFLYRRIFYNDRRFRIANTILGFLCLFWLIAATLGVALRCIPIKKNWAPNADGKCIKLQYFMVGFEVPNAAIDFIMIALPIKIIKDLRLPLFDKIALCITFMLGGLYVLTFHPSRLKIFVKLIYVFFSVGIFGIVRVGLLYNPNQRTLISYSPFSPMIWLSAKIRKKSIDPIAWLPDGYSTISSLFVRLSAYISPPFPQRTPFISDHPRLGSFVNHLFLPAIKDIGLQDIVE